MHLVNMTIGNFVRLTLSPGGACTGCGAYVYAGIYHKCGQPDRQGGPDGPIVEVAPNLIPAADSGVFSDPPKVNVTEGRTACSACGGPLKADERHVCPGNARFHGEAA